MVVRRISSPVFVGRHSELAALDAMQARAGNGDGSAVLVEGEAGIGKSRLMAQLESRGRAAGVAVLVGECLPLAEGELVRPDRGFAAVSDVGSLGARGARAGVACGNGNAVARG